MQDEKKNKKQLIEELQVLRAELRQRDEQQQSDEADRRYQSALENVIDGIITIDARGQIETFNRAAEKIFGYAAEEVLGRNINCLMPAPYQEEHDNYLHNYLATGNAKIIGIGREVTGRRKDGTTFPLDLAVSEFSQGDKRKFSGIVRDITERKQLEAQLVQVQKMESVGQLAGGIAHDFNNQLGIMLFDLDIMLAVREEADLREDLLKIRKVVLRAANLTRQLLLFSRRQQIQRQPLGLNGQVHELQKILDRLLGEHIAIEMNLAEELWTINADHGNIDQVVLNLAINSRDAMPEGGCLRLSTSNVEIDEAYCRHHSQARPGRFVCLAVSDTGTGMDEAVRRRVFEPFFTTKEVGKGTGLGLSVVYGIVEAHEGWIQLESTPNEGSCFSLYLPVLAQEPNAENTQADPPLTARHRGRGERLLLLEDQPDLRERALRVLSDQGYSVFACSTLAEARTLFRREDGLFNLLISDVALPDGRGPEWLLELRRQHAALPMLLMTGYMDEKTDWHRVQNARIPVLQKPFAVTDLLDAVQAGLK